jgi:hypothetical protein
VTGLKHPTEYRLTTSQKPEYFSKPFNNGSVTVNGVAGVYYDYQAADQLWVDFANHKLGGGVFGNGMVQEETMALSMPQLADAAAIGYDTRTDTGHAGPLNSDPTPLVFTNIQRTIELDRSLYKDGWQSQSLNQIKSHLTPQHPNQNVNVLAFAVEKVEGLTQQFELATMEDLFNTFVAAYTLAKFAMPGATINTGPIGTGDFNNDPETVYVMQKLALQQIGGLTINYWGLPSTDRYDNRVNQIISKWKTTADNSVNNLVKVAHACLTAQCA